MAYVNFLKGFPNSNTANTKTAPIANAVTVLEGAGLSLNASGEWVLGGPKATIPYITATKNSSTATDIARVGNASGAPTDNFPGGNVQAGGGNLTAIPIDESLVFETDQMGTELAGDAAYRGPVCIQADGTFEKYADTATAYQQIVGVVTGFNTNVHGRSTTTAVIIQGSVTLVAA